MFHNDGSISPTGVKWNEVDGVVVYKRDLYGVDLVCTRFTPAEGTVEVNEEMEGWATMTDALPIHLPGPPNRAD